MTAPVTPTSIVAYSGSLPDPSDPANYGTRGRALWAWETGSFYSGINLLAADTYTNAVSAAESAEAAMLSSGAAMWNAATNYATGVVAKSPTDMQSYSRNAPGGIDATDPAASANWTLVGTKFLKKAGDTMAGDLALSAKLTSDASNYPPTQLIPLFKCRYSNNQTHVGAAPTGTATSSGFWASNKSGVPAHIGGFRVDGDSMRVFSDRTSGASGYLPIRFNVGGLGDVVSINIDGTVSNAGTKGRQGFTGSSTGTIHNWWWTGSALQAWVDTSNVGTVTLTSDYRIKRDVRPMEQSALDRIARIRPVLYRYADNEQFSHKAEDREREGFIAHELAEVVPSAVEGEKDAPDQIQSLRVDALLAVMVKAMQEQQAQISDLSRRLALLEG